MANDETGIRPDGVAHVPVMEGQVVGGLLPRPGARLVDATVGLGGHAAALLAAAPDARLHGLDRDPAALARARMRLAPYADRVALHHATFAEVPRVLVEAAWADGADAVLLDLGVSSMQLDEPARGFSFRGDGPLDMRMDSTGPTTAADVVNDWPEDAIGDAIARWGEEPRARALARAIVRARPLRTTRALADVVSGVLGRGRPGMHPATRTFQAIRIAVNDELGILETALTEAWRWLRPGGRIAVLAYHSLEDRLVKSAMRRWAASCLCPPQIPQCVCGWTAKVRLVGGRPQTPTAEEIARNPRARSARLRVAERLPDGDRA